MLLESILHETPLPDDWDKNVYSGRTSFAKQLKYALERASKLAAGSSRVAFTIPYEGRETVLKIAKNPKGLDQNEHEAEMLSDWYLKKLEITIPMIDYDEENEQPKWIHTEKAEKLSPAKFKKIMMGMDSWELQRFLEYHTGNQSKHMSYKDLPPYESGEHEVLDSLIDLIGNFGLPIADFCRAANWGLYNNNPVIIDIGLSWDIHDKHYRR